MAKMGYASKERTRKRKAYQKERKRKKEGRRFFETRGQRRAQKT